MKRAPAILLLLLVGLAAGRGALVLAEVGYDRLIRYQGIPTASAPPAGGTTGQAAQAPAPVAGRPATPSVPPGPRVILILVDGLQARDASRLPALAHLAREGASFSVAPMPPAWPAPAWATALTGRQAAGHGLLLAAEYRPPGQPGLLQALRQHRLTVSAAGSQGFLKLVRPWLDKSAFEIPSGWEGTGTPLLAASQSALTAGADLTILHLEGLHAVAHRPEQTTLPPVLWDEALAWTDARLALMLQGADLTRSTVVVAGTYAAGPAGAHQPGATTALVFAGAGVAPGIPPGTPAAAVDLAPTLGVLLGVPPFATDGSPLWSALTPDRHTERAVWEELARQAHAVPVGDLRSRLIRWWEQVRPQAAWVGGIALVLLVYVAIALSRPLRGPLLLGLLVYGVAYHLLFFAMGGQFSAQLPHLEEPGPAFRTARLLQTAGAMLPAAIAVGWVQGRRGNRRPGHAAVAALHTNLVILSLLTLQVLGLLLWTGWGEHSRWPGAGWTVKFFLDAAQGMILGFGAPVWALVAGVTAAFSRALAGPQPDPVPPPAAPHPATGSARRRPVPRSGNLRPLRHTRR